MLVTKIEEVLPVFMNKELSVVGIDTETTGFDSHSDILILIQIATKDDVYVFDVNNTDKRMMKYVLDLIDARNIEVVAHNAKFDLKFIYANYGVMFKNVFDTMLAEAISFAGIGEKYISLDDLCRKYLRLKLDKSTRNSFLSYSVGAEITDEQLKYSEMDARVLIPLRDKLIPVIQEKGQSKIWELEKKVIPVVASMEYYGIHLDTNQWKALAETAKETTIELEKKLHIYLFDNFDVIFGKHENAYDTLEAIGFPAKNLKVAEKKSLKDTVVRTEIVSKVISLVNLGSHVQLKKIIKNLGYEIETTNAHELDKIRNACEFIDIVLTFKEQKKRRDAFGDKFLSHVNFITNAVHSDFNQLGTTTGRFSSEDPNLQNIISDESYRRPFVARPGYKLATTDYSNIELRIIGEASREPKFIDAFKHNEDLHRRTAAVLFDVPYDDVTHEQRKMAKSLNFAVIYGTTAKGLSYNFNIPLAKAQEFLRTYFERFNVLAHFIAVFSEKCMSLGYTVTMGGRKRFLSFSTILDSQEMFSEIATAKRQAVNTLPQGTSADMIKTALCKLYYNNPFGVENFRPILTVHDEIVVEFKEEIEEEAVKFINLCMKEAGETFLKIVPESHTLTTSYFWSK